MKKVIFDVDGVLLSEERYFDVSALTVWELLYSKDYMGLPLEGEDFDARHVTEGQIASCRSRVWGQDRLLAFLKAHGINSNWDMVHCWLITALWLMALTYEKRSGGEKVCLTLEKPSDMKEAGLALMGLPVPEAEEILAKWEAVIPPDLDHPHRSLSGLVPGRRYFYFPSSPCTLERRQRGVPVPGGASGAGGGYPLPFHQAQGKRICHCSGHRKGPGGNGNSFQAFPLV